MKKRIIAAVLLALLALGLCSCTAKEAKNEGYDLYRSSPVGVEIEYPDFWEVVDDKEEKSVAFATPLEGYADTYRDNVTVISYKLTEKSELAFDNYVSDYIASPKKSGYKSLHLLLNVPVTLDGKALTVPAEIQLRTAAMDLWASIEHGIFYKPQRT